MSFKVKYQSLRLGLLPVSLAVLVVALVACGGGNDVGDTELGGSEQGDEQLQYPDSNTETGEAANLEAMDPGAVDPDQASTSSVDLPDGSAQQATTTTSEPGFASEGFPRAVTEDTKIYSKLKLDYLSDGKIVLKHNKEIKVGSKTKKVCTATPCWESEPQSGNRIFILPLPAMQNAKGTKLAFRCEMVAGDIKSKVCPVKFKYNKKSHKVTVSFAGGNIKVGDKKKPTKLFRLGGKNIWNLFKGGSTDIEMNVYAVLKKAKKSVASQSVATFSFRLEK